MQRSQPQSTLLFWDAQHLLDLDAQGLRSGYTGTASTSTRFQAIRVSAPAFWVS
jgi:hypothetical protein